MKENLKTLYIKLILSFAILLLLSGCLGGREVNDLEIVLGLGIDKNQGSMPILLTAQVVKPQTMSKSASRGGGEEKSYWNVNSTGNSIFEAIRTITQKTGNRLFVAHSQVVIFGKDIATDDGLQKYIDFFIRSHEIRPTTLVIVSECPAAKVLDIKPETESIPSANISELVKAYSFTSHFYKVNINDFIKRIISGTTAPIAPLVSKQDKDVNVSGLAVFKNSKVVGTLNKDETRGLLWVLGEVKSGIINVPSPQEKGIAVLEITNSKSTVTPKLKENKIFFDIKIKEEASLSEQNTTENLATVPATKKLQENQAEVIRTEILAAFDKSKELKSDIFGFGDILQKRYKKQWESLKNNWDEIYNTIELNITIDTKILKTDLATKPAIPREEQKEQQKEEQKNE